MSVQTVSTGHTFLESPRWHEGALYVSDFFAKEILRFPDGTGAPEVVATVEGIPSGLGWLPDGQMLVVSMLDQQILCLTNDGLVQHADLKGRVRGVPNDMLVDDDGRCYVGSTAHSWGDESDFGPTSLLVVQPDGTVLTAIDDLNFPNGIVKLADGRLLVAETYAGRLRALTVGIDGVPVSAQVWADFNSVDYFDVEQAHAEVDVEPDGLCLGREGTVWIADAKGRGVARVREGGEVVEFVETGDLSVFAAQAVGSKLFLCCSPRNRTVDWSALRSSELRVADIE